MRPGWKKPDLERGDYIVASAGKQQWKRSDVFELKNALGIPTGGSSERVASLKVPPFAAPGDVVGQNPALFAREIKTAARRNPESRPGLQGDSFATNRVAE